MPNYVESRLAVAGQQNELDRFLTATAGVVEDGEAMPLSFEAVLPTPPDLLEGDGWLEWRCHHWGTKWDVDAELLQLDREPGKLVFHFPTAWDPPLALVAALAGRFPELDLAIVYGDESMGYAGIATFAAGECTNHRSAYCDRNDALDILNRHWPEEAEMWTGTEDDLDVEPPAQEPPSVPAADSGIVCPRCGSAEFLEYRAVRQLVSLDATECGFETTASADEDVDELSYECARCERELTGDDIAARSPA